MYQEMFDLSGKVALVTGGTGNLGAHLSKGLAEAGAEVILVSRNKEKQEALALEIQAAGGKCGYVPCDLTDMADVARMCDEAWDRRGHVDVIVHNAVPGTSSNGGIVDTPQEAWDTQTSVIYQSALVMFKTLCPRMVQGGGGSIISVVSSTGKTPQKGLVAYGIAKGSLLLLTKYTAQEFGPKVRANCITPGTIATTPTSRGTAIGDAILHRVAAGRRGRSEECVGATTFLASDAASYISGQVLWIDGGRF